MAQLNVLFDVPKWVEVGVKSGQLGVFGGVVRNNAGQILYHLKEGTKLARFAKGPFLLPVLALAAVAGIGYCAYKFMSRKATALEELETIDRAVLTYASLAQTERLGVEDIRALESELQKFISVVEAPEFKDTHLELDAECANKLREFYESVRTFNLRLRDKINAGSEVPQLVMTNNVPELAHHISQQLAFQKSAWPIHVAALTLAGHTSAQS